MTKASQSQFSRMKQSHKELILGPCLYTTTFCPSNAHTILCWSIAVFHCWCCFSWESPARLEQVFKCKCLCWKPTCLHPCEHWILRKSPSPLHTHEHHKIHTDYSIKSHQKNLQITGSQIKTCGRSRNLELHPEPSFPLAALSPMWDVRWALVQRPLQHWEQPELHNL